MKYLIVIAGATASGKTSVGIALAQHFDTEILSADSRQFYKELSIGTAKPTPEELTAAKHHFVDCLSIATPYSAGDFERDALEKLTEIFEKKDLALMVGGSGLFIQAVTDGFDTFPEVPPHIRTELTQLFENEGITALQTELARCDLAYYERVDLNNPQRLIRALEVCRATGRPYSAFRQQTKNPRPFQTIFIVLERPRAELHDRINRRVDAMLAAGLLEEVRRVLPYKNQNALQTVGYQEFYPYFEGEYDLEEAIRLVKRNSRRYAKRQETWFRRVAETRTFHPEQLDEIIVYIEEKVK